LNEEGTVLVINDNTSDGGNYNFTWDVLELNGSELRIVTSTSFGSLQVNMTRE